MSTDVSVFLVLNGYVTFSLLGALIKKKKKNTIIPDAQKASLTI